MEKRKRLWKGNKVSKVVAGLLALLLVINTCSSNMLWFVKAADEDCVTVTIAGNAITYTFTNAVEIESVSDTSLFEWDSKTSDEKRTFVNEMFNLNISEDEVSNALVSLAADTLDKTKVKTMTLTLNDGWCSINDSDYSNGIARKTITLNNSKISGTGGTITGTYAVDEFFVCPINGDGTGYDMTSSSTNFFADTSKSIYIISPNFAGGGYVNVDSNRVLISSHDTVSVKFIPDANHNIVNVYEDTQSVVTEGSVDVSPDGTYTLTYNYDDLCTQYSDTSKEVVVEAAYDYKSTEFGNISSEASTVYKDAEYNVSVDNIKIYDNSAITEENITWSLVKADSDEQYTGASLTKKDDRNYILKIENNAKDNDEFNIVLKDSKGVVKASEKITVSVPQAVLFNDYKFYTSSDGTEEANANSDGWYSQETFLKATGDYNKIEEENTGTKEDYVSFTVPNGENEESNRSFRLVKIDNEKIVKTSDWFTPELKVDAQKPVIDVSCTLADDSWSNEKQTITVAASDEISGIREVKYSLSADKTNAKTATLTANGYVFDTQVSDGENPTYYIWAIDNAGNESEVTQKQVHLEYTNPKIESVVNLSADDFVNEGHKIILTIKDEGGSGIDKITYQIPNGSPVEVSAAAAVLENDTYTFEIDTLKDGNNYITDTNEYTFTAYDNAGNESDVAKTTVHVDKVKSEVTDMTIVVNDEAGKSNFRPHTVFGHFSNDNVIVTVMAKKNASLSKVKVISLLYTDENNVDTVITASAIEVSGEVSQSGEDSVYYKAILTLPASWITSTRTKLVFNEMKAVATDAVGNESVAVKYSQLNTGAAEGENNILIEKTAPSISFDLQAIKGEDVYTDAQSQLWVASHRTINYSVIDAGSGIYKYTTKLNNSTVSSNITEASQKVTTLLNNAISTDSKSETGKNISAVDSYKYTMYVEVYDNAGNFNSESVDMYVDLKAPVITEVKTTADGDDDGWVSESSVKFEIKADDDTGSGIKKVVYYAVDEGVQSGMTPSQMVANGKEITQNNGVYEFEAIGEQNRVYYIFAIDNVGNISESVTKNVKIDLTTPSVDSVSIEPVNSYKYGNFKNDNVTLLLNVSDGTISSGVKSVKIYDNDTLISEEVTTVEANKRYECNIIASIQYDNLIVEVTDNVGHVITKELSKVSETDTIDSNLLKLEKVAPSIDISFKEESINVSGNDWFNKNTQITVDISDEVSEINSGLSSVIITLQAADVEPKVMKYDYTGYDNAVMSNIYTLATSDINVPYDGKYEIITEVSDNAGNSAYSSKTVYVDSTVPVVKNVKLYSSDVEFSSDNMLSFGNFYNTDTIVKVYFVDDNASSGIEKSNIILHVGDREIVPTGDITVEDGQFVASYKILLNTNAQLKTEITDNVGHTTGVETISSKNASILNDNLMLENSSADISVTASDAVYTEKKNGTSKAWYDSQVTFTIDVKDSQSGIRSVNADINTTSKVNENYNKLDSKTTEKQYTISTVNSKELDSSSGAYKLQISAYDNANNKSEYSKVVYIDTLKPFITKYEFSVENYKEGSPTPVITTDYGYYFNQSVKLTVTAQDNAPTSGLAKINYRFDEAGNDKGEVKQAVVSNNQITIDVPKGFKGQIYTQAVDNVGNYGEWQSVDGVIREEGQLHEDSSNITITPLISTDMKDDSGKDLYSQNVPLRLHVEDNMSGVRTIEWKLESPGDPLNNQGGTLDVANAANASQLAGDGGWNVISRDENLCTVFEKDIVCMSNSNDIAITVKMTDRAGNVSQSVHTFSIDKTLPQISVSYDNNVDDESYEGFFKESRIATVTVSERNFNPDNMKIEITNSDDVMPTMTDWVKAYDGTENGDNTLYRMNIIYDHDGDYTFNVYGTDMAGNQNTAVDYNDSVTPSQFTIDKTIPVISLSYDNSQVYDDYYYQDTRTATITINEHNFDASRAIVTVTSKNNDGSNAQNVPSVGSWSSANDVNTAQVVFDKDSNYTIAVTYTDMAGNIAQEIAEQRFCIDYIDPEIIISNIEDRHAYNGKDDNGNDTDIAPVVTFKDTNLSVEKTNITLTNSEKENIELKGTSENPSADTRIFTFDNIEEDDIYTLSVNAVDNAGRKKEISYRFSVNRNGSTYELSEETAKMNSSYTNNPVDVVVKEINVDPLVQDEISVTLAKDNNAKELVSDTTTQINDYSVDKSGNDGEWSEYTYTIRKDNFSEDGNYMIHLYSVDEATNVSQNDLNEDNKKKEINFNVDKTKPDVSIINIEEGKTYGEDQRNAIISVVDNSYVKELTVELNGEVVAEYSADEIKQLSANNENIEVLISNSTSRQKLEVMAIDAAGNDNSAMVSDFLVTRNLWARFVNNTALVVGTIVAGCVIIFGGGTSVILFRRRKVSSVKSKEK